VYGPTTFKLKDLKIDPENVVFTFKINLPKLEFRGKYQIDAQILLLKLIGEGNVTGTLRKFFSKFFAWPKQRKKYVRARSMCVCGARAHVCVCVCGKKFY